MSRIRDISNFLTLKENDPKNGLGLHFQALFFSEKVIGTVVSGLFLGSFGF